MSEPLTVPVSWEDRPFLITAAGSENLVLRTLLAEVRDNLRHWTKMGNIGANGLIDLIAEALGEPLLRPCLSCGEETAAPATGECFCPHCKAEDDTLPPITFGEWETAFPDDDPDIYAGTYSED